MHCKCMGIRIARRVTQKTLCLNVKPDKRRCSHGTTSAADDAEVYSELSTRVPSNRALVTEGYKLDNHYTLLLLHMTHIKETTQ